MAYNTNYFLVQTGAGPTYVPLQTAIDPTRCNTTPSSVYHSIANTHTTKGIKQVLTTSTDTTSPAHIQAGERQIERINQPYSTTKPIGPTRPKPIGPTLGNYVTVATPDYPKHLNSFRPYTPGQSSTSSTATQFINQDQRYKTTCPSRSTHISYPNTPHPAQFNQNQIENVEVENHLSDHHAMHQEIGRRLHSRGDIALQKEISEYPTGVNLTKNPHSPQDNLDRNTQPLNELIYTANQFNTQLSQTMLTVQQNLSQSLENGLNAAQRQLQESAKQHQQSLENTKQGLLELHNQRHETHKEIKTKLDKITRDLVQITKKQTSSQKKIEEKLDQLMKQQSMQQEKISSFLNQIAQETLLQSNSEKSLAQISKKVSDIRNHLDTLPESLGTVHLRFERNASKQTSSLDNKNEFSTSAAEDSHQASTSATTEDLQVSVKKRARLISEDKQNREQESPSENPEPKSKCLRSTTRKRRSRQALL